MSILDECNDSDNHTSQGQDTKVGSGAREAAYFSNIFEKCARNNKLICVCAYFAHAV